ncbi:unnamed protein product [Polarella glacialis]|uniref:Palmitoyltransferase n=1 Tax=Polarella glacialis TaxID=89957 RepID=A0A813FW93_POLGL|nr:unnamed protein product [Polarella glacialis]CAE8733736.1 unnamed protein product [Polarella glacialis]
MDHHCVFANNCIGAANVKPFRWLVLYNILGSGSILLVNGWQLVRHWHGLWSQRTPACLVVSCLFAFGLFGDMVMVGCFQLYLFTTGQSTIEVYKQLFGNDEAGFGCNKMQCNILLSYLDDVFERMCGRLPFFGKVFQDSAAMGDVAALEAKDK